MTRNFGVFSPPASQTPESTIIEYPNTEVSVMVGLSNKSPFDRCVAAYSFLWRPFSDMDRKEGV